MHSTCCTVLADTLSAAYHGLPHEVSILLNGKRGLLKELRCFCVLLHGNTQVNWLKQVCSWSSAEPNQADVHTMMHQYDSVQYSVIDSQDQVPDCLDTAPSYKQDVQSRSMCVEQSIVVSTRSSLAS